MKNNIILLRDIAVILVFILLAGGIFFIVKNNSKESSCAVIKKDGKVIETISLDKDCENFTVDGADNMSFTVRNGKIAVFHSDCPDKICIKTGFISKKGEMAVCLPNRVSVEIVSSDDDNADVVVG